MSKYLDKTALLLQAAGSWYTLIVALKGHAIELISKYSTEMLRYAQRSVVRALEAPQE